MSRLKKQLGLLVILLIIVAAVFWFLREPEKREVKRESHPSAIDTRDYEAVDLIPTGQAPTERGEKPPMFDKFLFGAMPDQPREAWQASISLLLIDEATQEPIPGVQVYLTGVIRVPPAYSDPDGNVSFSRLPAGAYEYQLIHDKYAQRQSHFSTRLVLDKDEHMEKLVEMEASCVTKGRVLDAQTKAPIAGVRVFPHRYKESTPIKTDADGRFEIATGFKTQSNIYLKKEGYAPRELRRKCYEKSLDIQEFLLTPEWELRGLVLDDMGDPLPGVLVRDYYHDPLMPPPANLIETTTDAQGNFTMKGLPPTGERIYFYKEGYADETAVVALSRSDYIEVRMKPVCTLSGVIVNESGAPVDGVSINASLGEPGYRDITDEKGAFSISKLKEGKVKLMVNYTAEGGTLYQEEEAECVRNGEPVRIEISVEAETFAEGVTVDDVGQPVANALLFAKSVSQKKLIGDKMKLSSSDEFGRFTIAVPAEGIYSLYAVHLETNRIGFEKDLEGKQTGLKITISKKTTAKLHNTNETPERGNVVADGQNVKDFHYCWGHCNVLIPADEAGQWSSDGFKSYFSTLWVVLPDGRIGKANTRTLGKTGGVLEVGEGATVTGRLGDGFPEGLTTLSLAGTEIVRQNIEEEFTLPLLPPGSYMLELRASSGRAHRQPFSVTDGEPLDLGVIEFSEK